MKLIYATAKAAALTALAILVLWAAGEIAGHGAPTTVADTCASPNLRFCFFIIY